MASRADPTRVRVHIDVEKGVSAGSRPRATEPESARVWREMGGDLTVANFLHVLGFAKNTVTNSIASIRAAKIRDINQLLGLTIQRLREIGLDIDVILRIVHVARDILVELQWTDATVSRVLKAARSGGLVLYECEGTNSQGQVVEYTRWLPATGIPEELEQEREDAYKALPVLFVPKGEKKDETEGRRSPRGGRDSDASEKSPKRGRGRPPKEKKEDESSVRSANSPKRGPGRPPKSEMKQEKEESASPRRPRKSESAAAEGRELFDVEAIVDERGARPLKQYLVKWTGYEEPTWEPSTAVRGLEALAVFRNKKTATSEKEEHSASEKSPKRGSRSPPKKQKEDESSGRSATSLKRGPGRSPKEKKEDESSVRSVTSPKRGPGRPRKSDVAPADAEEKSNASATSSPKRGPGRLRKSDVAPASPFDFEPKKKRGRPRKSDVAPAAAAEKSQSPATKRGPSRPRKNGVAPAKDKGARAEKDETAEKDGASQSVVKKRGPGKPRKSEAAAFEKEADEASNASAKKAKSNEEESSAKAPAPKKRGRSRKGDAGDATRRSPRATRMKASDSAAVSQLQTDSSSEEDSEEERKTTYRPRGRRSSQV